MLLCSTAIFFVSMRKLSNQAVFKILKRLKILRAVLVLTSKLLNEMNDAKPLLPINEPEGFESVIPWQSDVNSGEIMLCYE